MGGHRRSWKRRVLADGGAEDAQRLGEVAGRLVERAELLLGLAHRGMRLRDDGRLDHLPEVGEHVLAAAAAAVRMVAAVALEAVLAEAVLAMRAPGGPAYAL